MRDRNDPMGPADRTMRIFISSTFLDLQAERDELMKHVVPELRRLCAARDVALTVIDLRWGIDEEQKAEGNVLPICLAEIAKCRPYFIGVLGERYGSVLTDSGRLDAWPRLRDLVRQDHSVTHLEMLYGVLDDPEVAEEAYFYFRDPAYIETLPEDQRAKHRDEPTAADIARLGPEAARAFSAARRRRLEDLKAAIRASGRPVRENVASPRDLAAQVRADFRAVIERRFPSESIADPGERERGAHAAYARRKARHFVGREGDLQALEAQLRAGDRGRIVLSGAPGTGKSALLAHWAAAADTADGPTVILHMVGATPRSAEPVYIVEHLLQALKARFALSEPLPRSDQAQADALPKWLALAAGSRKLVLILDGLDDIERADGGALGWLPDPPRNVWIVASAGVALAGTLAARGWRPLELANLPLPDRRRLVGEYLREEARRLDADLLEAVATAPLAANPLALRALLDELRLLGSADRVREDIARYRGAGSARELFAMIIARWVRDYERDRSGQVRDTLALIAAARRGLTEDEIRQLLGVDGQPLPAGVWAPVLQALDPFVVDLDGVLAFHHPEFRAAVEAACLAGEADLADRRGALARHFAEQEPSLRRADEQPWLALQLADWDGLRRSLTDLDLLTFAWARGRRPDWLAYWGPLAARCEPGAAYEAALEDGFAGPGPALRIADAGAHIGWLLEDLGCPAAALRVKRRVLEVRRRELRAGHPQIAAALNDLAEHERVHGDPQAALRLFQDALALFRAEHGERHPDVALVLQNLAVLLSAQHRHAAAIDLLEEALSIVDGAGDDAAGVVVPILLNLADVQRLNRDFAAAETTLSRVARICDRDLAADHPYALARTQRLANLRGDQGRRDEATTLHEQALAGHLGRFGDGARAAAVMRFNLGRAYKEAGRLTEAEGLYTGAIAALEAAEGTDHRLVADGLVALADLHRVQRRFVDAVACGERALRSLDTTTEPVRQVRALAELGRTHLDAGDLRAALPHLDQALRLCQDTQPPDEAALAVSLSLLAEVDRRAGRLGPARQRQTHALALRERPPARDPAAIAESLNNLACIDIAEGDYATAEARLRRALPLKIAELGEDHPLVADGLNNLGMALYHQGRDSEAATLHRTALALREKALGAVHPAVAESLGNLGMALSAAGDLEGSADCHGRALDILQGAGGPDHPETARALQNLGTACYRLGRRTEAADLLRQALRVATTALGAVHPDTALIRRNLAVVEGSDD